MICGVEEMVGGLFKGGQHEHGLLHLGQAVAGDAERFAPAGHEVGQEGDVSAIDGHAVAAHGVLDLAHDGLPRRLDAQGRGHFQSVVGRRSLFKFY